MVNKLIDIWSWNSPTFVSDPDPKVIYTWVKHELNNEKTEQIGVLFSLTRKIQEDIHRLLYQRPSKWPFDQMEVHLTLEKVT